MVLGDNLTSSKSFALKEIFSNFIAVESPSGEIADVAEILATKEINRTNFRDIRPHVLLSSSTSFRDGLLGMILYYARACVKDHKLTTDEKENLQLLKTLFEIKEGEFYSRKTQELSNLLSQQVLWIIQDRRLENTEDLYQSELQGIFRLSYDQYVGLTQKTVKDFLETLSENESKERVEEIQQIRVAFLISA